MHNYGAYVHVYTTHVYTCTAFLIAFRKSIMDVGFVYFLVIIMLFAIHKMCIL